MATGLPYFKFTPSEWLTGDIVFESFEVQGLFINICALYWQRDGNLTLEGIEMRYKQPTALPSLIGRFITVSESGKISIDFLDIQFEERGFVSKTNSDNGKKGGRPKVIEEIKSEINRPLSDRKANQSQEEEEKNKNKNKNKKENKNEGLILPYQSEDFKKAWEILVNEPKWRKKSTHALSLSLEKLGGYSEIIAIKMIKDCIGGNWQGLVEPKTIFKKPENPHAAVFNEVGRWDEDKKNSPLTYKS